MTRLEHLQSAKSLSDLAKLLNYTPKGLAYVLYKTSVEARYSTFKIPKSGGGVRTLPIRLTHTPTMDRLCAHNG